MTDERQNDRSYAGFRSREGKQRFSIIVGILGAAAFFGQFVLPMVVFMATGPFFFMQGFQTGFPRPRTAVQWRGKAWYLTGQLDMPRHPVDNNPLQPKLMRLEKDGPQEVSGVNPSARWLWPTKKGLHVFGSQGTWLFDGKELRGIGGNGVRHRTTPPFEWNGQPAVVAEKPGKLRIHRWNGTEWEKRKTMPKPSGLKKEILPDGLRAVSVGDRIFFFCAQEGEIYLHRGMLSGDAAFPAAWESVAYTDGNWAVSMLDGRLAVFARRKKEKDFAGEVVGYARSDGQWEPFSSVQQGLTIGGIRILPAGNGAFTLITQGFPGSLQVVKVKGGKVESREVYGGFGPFSGTHFLFMLIPNVTWVLVPLVLSIIIAILMKRYRLTSYRTGSMEADYASLTRRAFAQVVDSLIAGAPLVYGFVGFFSSWQKLFQIGQPPASLMFLPLMTIGTCLWGPLLLLIFSFTEGRWGKTPGKLLLGIRVVGSDLEPCGFGRAFLRNLLKLVDGFFNFLVGVLLVAYTQNWQRVGDMAADTIVIRRLRSEPGHGA